MSVGISDTTLRSLKKNRTHDGIWNLHHPHNVFKLFLFALFLSILESTQSSCLLCSLSLALHAGAGPRLYHQMSK